MGWDEQYSGDLKGKSNILFLSLTGGYTSVDSITILYTLIYSLEVYVLIQLTVCFN
jgi:hypothetical protein